MAKVLSMIQAVLLAVTLAGCAAGTPAPGRPAPSHEIIISAAVSLSDVLTDSQAQFEQEHPGIKLRFNFGSSGALAQQIRQGAPVDLFIAAGPEPMDALVKEKLVEQAHVSNLASNQVVLIRSRSAAGIVTAWDELKSGRVTRIALADPAHVPAGQYGRAVLQKLALWDSVQKRLVYGEDVRQVLAYVASGEAQTGIVYATDAATSSDVVVVAEAPPGTHPPVVYPMATIKGARNETQARLFADYLRSARGRELLRKYGFGE